MADTPAADDASLYREFQIGQVLSRAFDVFFKHMAIFTLIATVVFLPLPLLGGVLLSAVGSGSAPPEQIGVISFWISLLTFALSLVCTALATAVILYGAFQHMRGYPVRLGESITRGLARFLPLLGLIVLQMLGVMLGAFLLIIPGLILLVMWYVAVPVCVVERTGPVKSLSRSQELTKGFRWKLFGLFLLVLIVSALGGNVLPIAGGALAGFWGQVAVSIVWQGLSQAFGSVLIVVTYYYLRVAKEGMDIEAIAAVFD
jgi:hypothetical protein